MYRCFPFKSGWVEKVFDRLVVLQMLLFFPYRLCDANIPLQVKGGPAINGWSAEHLQEKLEFLELCNSLN